MLTFITKLVSSQQSAYLSIFILLVACQGYSRAEFDMIRYETSIIDIMNEDVGQPEMAEDVKQLQQPVPYMSYGAQMERDANDTSEGSGVDDICPLDQSSCRSSVEESCELTNADSSSCSCDCDCNPGYTTVDGHCQKVKAFGGAIVYEEEFTNTEAQKEKYGKYTIDYLTKIYKDDTGFIRVDIISVEEGSVIVKHELVYTSTAPVNKSTIEETLNTNCTDMAVANATVNCSRTVELTTEQIGKCEKNFDAVCDVISTDCRVDDDGEAFCVCKTDFVGIEGNFYECTPQVCTANADCNSPFGWCTEREDEANSCTCMWGFEGQHCKNAWLFIFTVVTSSLGLIVLVVTSSVCCYARRMKRGVKKSSQSPRSSTPASIRMDPFSDYEPGQMRARLPSPTVNNGIEIMTSSAPPTRPSSGHRQQQQQQQEPVYSSPVRKSQRNGKQATSAAGAYGPPAGAYPAAGGAYSPRGAAYENDAYHGYEQETRPRRQSTRNVRETDYF